MQKGLKAIGILIVLLVLSFFIALRIMKPKEEVEGKPLPTVTCISMEKGDISVKEKLSGRYPRKSSSVYSVKYPERFWKLTRKTEAKSKKGKGLPFWIIRNRLMLQSTV